MRLTRVAHSCDMTQVELIVGAANSFTAVTQGPCQLLILDRTALTNPQGRHSQLTFWFSRKRSAHDQIYYAK